MGQGGEKVRSVESIAEGDRRRDARRPALELAGIESAQVLGETTVADGEIERHGYCSRMLTTGGPRSLLVYLTAEGLVTDQDVLIAE
jgi:hypothetical protein